MVCIATAISATYEFIERAVCFVTGVGGDSFIGTQDCIWDTQSDILFASIGANIALLLFGKYQRIQIKELNI